MSSLPEACRVLLAAADPSFWPTWINGFFEIFWKTCSLLDMRGKTVGAIDHNAMHPQYLFVLRIFLPLVDRVQLSRESYRKCDHRE